HRGDLVLPARQLDPGCKGSSPDWLPICKPASEPQVVQRVVPPAQVGVGGAVTVVATGAEDHPGLGENAAIHFVLAIAQVDHHGTAHGDVVVGNGGVALLPLLDSQPAPECGVHPVAELAGDIDPRDPAGAFEWRVGVAKSRLVASLGVSLDAPLR